MNTRIWRTFIVILLATVSACSGKKEGEQPAGTSGAPQPGQQQTASAAADESAAGTAAQLQLRDLSALVDLVVAEANALPRAEFDPAALAAKLGRDPQAHFDWVRNRTWWAPYRGLLRGSQGVMLDRVGSSLDRAVLLGDLLRRAGHTVRLANVQLSEAQARDLLGKLKPIPAERRASVAPGEMPTEERRAMATLLPDLEKEVERETAATSRIRAEAEALVRSQSDMLLAAVRLAEKPDDAEKRLAIAALRDHWWVERRDGDKWIAMDLLTPAMEAGDALPPSTSTSEWREVDAFPSIPEEYWHAVQLRVVVERYDAGATQESTVLELTLRPAELIERPVILGHMPKPWPGDLVVPADPGKLREAALAVREWVPYIRVGDEFVVQSGYSIGGDLRTNALESDNLGKVGGAEVAGGMDMALGGFGGDEVVPAATAEWLDFEIRVPGSPREVLRRQVFDLLGTARRASKASDFDGTADLRKLERFEALFSDTDILLQPCEFTDEFVVNLFAADVVANQAAIRKLSQEADPAKIKLAAAEIVEHMTVWGPLPSLALWRSALGGQSSEIFLDRPNVLSYRVSQVVLNAEEPTFRSLVDIASNSTGIRQDANRSAFEVRLRQGVADTVAEMLVLGNDLRMSANTASIFAQLAAEGSRGLLIAARDRDAAKALPWPEDETARVAADIEAGYMALVPRKAVLLDGDQRVGWWRVNPASGETIGVMDTGFHAGTSEDTLTRARQQLKILRDFYNNNRGHIRTVLYNPNSFPNKEVHAYKSLVRVLREVDVKLAGSL